jgi:hypothetical protein
LILCQGLGYTLHASFLFLLRLLQITTKKVEEDISLGFFLDVKNACHGTPLFPMKRRRGGNWHHNMDQSFRSMNPAAGARWIRKKEKKNSTASNCSGSALT